MTPLDERGQAIENKFAHKEKLNFETEARGSKIFGLWIAEQLGLSGDNAMTYAKTVVSANLEEPGFDDILRKVKTDLEERKIELSDHILNSGLEKAMAEAQRQVMSTE